MLDSEPLHQYLSHSFRGHYPRISSSASNRFCEERCHQIVDSSPSRRWCAHETSTARIRSESGPHTLGMIISNRIHQLGCRSPYHRLYDRRLLTLQRVSEMYAFSDEQGAKSSRSLQIVPFQVTTCSNDDDSRSEPDPNQFLANSTRQQNAILRDDS